MLECVIIEKLRIDNLIKKFLLRFKSMKNGFLINVFNLLIKICCKFFECFLHHLIKWFLILVTFKLLKKL